MIIHTISYIYIFIYVQWWRFIWDCFYNHYDLSSSVMRLINRKKNRLRTHANFTNVQLSISYVGIQSNKWAKWFSYEITTLNGLTDSHAPSEDRYREREREKNRKNLHKKWFSISRIHYTHKRCKEKKKKNTKVRLSYYHGQNTKEYANAVAWIGM